MIEELIRYQPQNEQEQKDKELMLRFLREHEDAYDRSNLAAHVTASAIVVNEAMDHVLFAHHNIYDSFGWVGGHNDGETDSLAVAIQEAKEETGIQDIRPATTDIIGVDVIHVTNHIKHGAYVPDHLHLNVTHLLIASEQETPTVNPREHSDVRWFTLEAALEVITEERMRPVYEKLFARVRSYRNKKRSR